MGAGLTFRHSCWHPAFAYIKKAAIRPPVLFLCLKFPAEIIHTTHHGHPGNHGGTLDHRGAGAGELDNQAGAGKRLWIELIINIFLKSALFENLKRVMR